MLMNMRQGIFTLSGAPRVPLPIWIITSCTFLSSANEIWVGHRNAGHPSVRLSVYPSVLPSVSLSFRPSDL